MNHRKSLIVYFLFGLILVQYQNCAQNTQELGSSVSNDSTVDVIDHVDAGAVFFPQTKVTAHEADDEVSVVGACDQSGAIISWTLKSQDGSLIERGHSECDTGSFIVELSDEWKKFCDENLILKASLGAKASSETEVEPNCGI